MILRNKTILVTGAGSGMGRELVIELTQRGAGVAAVDINAESLQETIKKAGASSRQNTSHIADISKKDSVQTLLSEVLEEQGSIDGIINNAGIIQPFISIQDLSYEAIDRVMQVNFYGTLFMVKTFLPELLKRQEAYIVNVSSMGGFLPVPGQTLYGATKAAIKLLTEGLHSELIGTSVHVTVVFPGAVNTNITVNSGVESPVAQADGKKSKIDPLSAKTAAKIILDGMEKNQARVFVGKDSKMLDILYRLNPGFASNLIAKQMKELLSKKNDVAHSSVQGSAG